MDRGFLSLSGAQEKTKQNHIDYLLYEYVLFTSFLDTYRTLRRYFPPNPQPINSTCCRSSRLPNCIIIVRLWQEHAFSTYFSRHLHDYDDNGPRRTTVNLPCLCYPSPLRSCLPAFLSLVQVGALRVEAFLRKLRSCIYLQEDLFRLQSFLYGVHVRNDRRRKFSLLCAFSVIFDFTAASYLVPGIYIYGCVHGTSKPSQSARFDCNIIPGN